MTALHEYPPSHETVQSLQGPIRQLKVLNLKTLLRYYSTFEDCSIFYQIIAIKHVSCVLVGTVMLLR
jgi:hypothetical protein